jgi:hypothetical protein
MKGILLGKLATIYKPDAVKKIEINNLIVYRSGRTPGRPAMCAEYAHAFIYRTFHAESLDRPGSAGESIAAPCYKSTISSLHRFMPLFSGGKRKPAAASFMPRQNHTST